LLADHTDVHGNLAPAVDRIAVVQDLGLDDRPAALLAVEVGARQEDHADRELAAAGLVARVLDVLAEEALRDLDVDAGAVAGLAGGVDGAAMPPRLQRIDRRLDHRATRLAVDRRDEADTAGIVLLGGIVEPGRFQMRGIDAELLGEALAGCLRMRGHYGPPFNPPRPRAQPWSSR